MYQREHAGRQNSNTDLRWPVSGSDTQTSKRLKVLILGTGGRQDHFTQILAANVRQWGYEASILSASMVLGGMQGKAEEEGDILVYDLDDALHMSTLKVRETASSVSYAAPYLTSSDKGWPRVRLMIALSSRSVSRLALEQIGAVALLYKPFQMERLQRYLQAFQQVLHDEPESLNGDASPRSAATTTVGKGVQRSFERSARILVVEDHPHVAETIRQCLECEPRYDIRI